MRTRGSYWNLVRVVLLFWSCATGLPASGQPSNREPSFVPAKTKFKSPRVVARIDLSDGRPILSVSINGAGSYRMLLDTTARVPVIDIRVVRKAALTTIGRFNKSAALVPGVESANLVHVRSLSIGDAEFGEFDVLAVDLNSGKRARRRLDGTLPLAFFSESLITLDGEAGQLVIEKGELPEPDEKSVLGYADLPGAPTVKLTLKDLAVDFVIDTSSRNALTFPAELKGDVVSAYRSKPGRLLVGAAKRKRAREPDDAGLLRLGRHEVSYAPFEFREGASTIGWKILQHFAVTFDPRNDRVRFVRKTEWPMNFSFSPKFGLELASDRNAMVVVSVFPDSPIDRSVIEVGSRIVEIEGRPARDYTPGALRSLMDRRTGILFMVESSGFRLLVGVDAEGY
ncbi:MAG: aspartyl protease family protein [Planctomycetes bacterium]|nr:aspartyl protease family protein [Planctomycetota bacterium]